MTTVGAVPNGNAVCRLCCRVQISEARFPISLLDVSHVDNICKCHEIGGETTQFRITWVAKELLYIYSITVVAFTFFWGVVNDQNPFKREACSFDLSQIFNVIVCLLFTVISLYATISSPDKFQFEL